MVDVMCVSTPKQGLGPSYGSRKLGRSRPLSTGNFLVQWRSYGSRCFAPCVHQKDLIKIYDKASEKEQTIFGISSCLLKRSSSKTCMLGRRGWSGQAFVATASLDVAPAEDTSLVPLKRFDLVTLSNLCVDIVVSMDELPEEDEALRKRVLNELLASPPPKSQWEVGGNTNTLIAASRLGMRVAAIGHIGNDIYGDFLEDVLEKEGVLHLEPVDCRKEEIDAIQVNSDYNLDGSLSFEDRWATLLCFVLVTPDAQHAFVSLYDFGPWPLLSFADKVTESMQNILEDTAAVFVNGFVFDELPADIVIAAANHAAASGAAIFFDPGPRSWTFCESGATRRKALESMLDISDVVLMTEEEAEVVTGTANAEHAARYILDRQGTKTKWCIIKRGSNGALLASKTIPDAYTNESMIGYKADIDERQDFCSLDSMSQNAIYEQKALNVDVRDTVGCGDSFAAAIILGYTRQHCIAATMALASAVGAATAMGLGAGRNVAKIEDVEELLKAAVPDCEDGRHARALKVLYSGLKGHPKK